MTLFNIWRICMYTLFILLIPFILCIVPLKIIITYLDNFFVKVIDEALALDTFLIERKDNAPNKKKNTVN